MVYYIVPVFSHMEPFENANKELLSLTLENIPRKFKKRLIVATNEDWAVERVKDTRVKGLHIDPKPQQNPSMQLPPLQDILIRVRDTMNMGDDDDFVTLPLHYPDRTYRNIRSAIQFYRKHSEADSLLCRRPAQDHPFKMIYEAGQNRGRPVVLSKGSEWNEDSYPEVFLCSHFVSIHKVGILEDCTPWLWKERTVFFPIEDVTRIKTEDQFKSYDQKE